MKTQNRLSQIPERKKTHRCSPLQGAIRAVPLLAVVLTTSFAQGADFTWLGSGADKNWSTSANWPAPGSPSSQSVLFTNAGAGATASTVTSIVDANYSINSLNMNYEAPVGANTTTYQNIQINSGSTLTVNGNTSIGSTTETTYTSNLNYTNQMTIGGSGSLVVNGGGTANFTVLPTNTTTAQLRYRRSAILDMQSLATFTANNLDKFVLGADQNGGSTYQSSRVTLGSNNTIQASSLVMEGYYGKSLLQLGTTNVLHVNNILIGQQDLTSPTQTWSGGAAEIVFRSGVTGGTIEIRGKDGVSAANITVGRSGLAPAAGAGGTGEGTLNLEGGTMDAKVNNLVIGLADQGTTSLTSGAAVTGIATLGAGTMNAVNVVVGRTTTGNTNTNSGITSAATLTIRNKGTLDVSGSMIIGDAQQGSIALTSTVNLELGTLKASSIETGANAASNKTVAFNWTGGPNTAIQNHAGGNITIDSGMPLTLLGTGVHNFIIDANQTGTVNSAILSGAGVGGLTKSGLGALILNSSGNTYTGATTVSDGKLVVNGSLAGTTSASVASGAELTVNGLVNTAATVAVEGTLSGNGTVGAVSVAGGTLSPGNSIGTINTGNLSLSGSAHLSIEIGRTLDGAGTLSNDVVNVLGTVNLASGADLQLSLASGLFNPINGDILYLLINDGSDVVTGAFTKLNGVDTILTESSLFTFNSTSYQITYGANYEGSALTGGNDIALVVVPEPTTWVLLTSGMGLLIGAQRLRRRHVRTF